jgi:formylglycine-generating enzyme required for sulfatase activity
MKRTRTTALATLLLAPLASCSTESATLPPAGHHVVTIDTDAIVPGDPAQGFDPAAPVPLFDRLELAIFRDGELEPSPESVRDFPVDLSTFGSRGATFTIEAEPGESVRVRARLFRDASSFGGEPRPETTIEVVAALPPTPEEGPVETTIALDTEDVGVPRGTLEAPLAVDDAADARVRAGAITESRVGTWIGALRVPCSVTPADGEACVDGGAYWMGNPLVKGDDFVESDRQRLVVLSPYRIDTREVRVGELRAWLATQPPEVDTVTRAREEKGDPRFFCTYTDTPTADSEGRPANCVSWEVANAYCVAKGGALPTEAQFEYASSELRSALFVWGADEAPLCEAAVWGRSGLEGSSIENVGASDCKYLGEGPQSLPDELVARDATRLTDRIAIGGVEVFDLAGNLQEWVLDRYNKQDEPCWRQDGTNVFVDPVCTTPGEIGGRSVRGGSWIQSREFLRAAYRANREPTDTEAFVVGFRCARPGG